MPLPPQLADNPQHAARLVFLVKGHEGKVRTEETRPKDMLFNKPKLDLDIVNDPGGGGSRKGKKRHLRMYLPQRPNVKVRWPEIVPPLGNAVGFIYRKKIDLHVPDTLLNQLAAEPLG